MHLLNSLPHNLEIWRPREKRLLKTLREKEKMLVTSIFFFSHTVFYPFFLGGGGGGGKGVCKFFQFGQVQFFFSCGKDSNKSSYCDYSVRTQTRHA